MLCCEGVNWRAEAVLRLASVVANNRVVFSRLCCSWSLLMAGASSVEPSLAPPFRTTTLPEFDLGVVFFFAVFLFNTGASGSRGVDVGLALGFSLGDGVCGFWAGASDDESGCWL